MGTLHRTGDGVEQDDIEAARWYLLAAEQGYATSQYYLGFIYRDGIGVEQDITEARRWLSLAAEQGERFAIDALTNPVFGTLPRDADGIAGIYGGSYRCLDGEHGFYLELVNIADSPFREDEKRLWGTLGFFPVLAGAGGVSAHVAGSFTVYGSIKDGNQLQLSAREWLVEPQGYGSASLQGELAQREDGSWQITGVPRTSIPDHCSDLIATQFLP